MMSCPFQSYFPGKKRMTNSYKLTHYQFEMNPLPI